MKRTPLQKFAFLFTVLFGFVTCLLAFHPHSLKQIEKETDCFVCQIGQQVKNSTTPSIVSTFAPPKTIGTVCSKTVLLCLSFSDSSLPIRGPPAS